MLLSLEQVPVGRLRIAKRLVADGAAEASREGRVSVEQQRIAGERRGHRNSGGDLCKAANRGRKVRTAEK